MTDYIKREDAIQKFAGVTLIECDKTTAESPYSLSAAEKFFADIPSADVIEVDKVNKIYEKLADLLDAPCNYSPCDEIMLESERCIEDCGNISDAECWKRYFEVVCDGERTEA